MAQTILELKLKGVNEAQADMQRLSLEIEKQRQRQAELKTEMKATQKAFKDGEISQEDYTKAMAQNTIEQEKAKKVISENRSQLRQNIRVTQAQEGSLDQLRASLNLLQKEYGQINKETAEGARKAMQYSDRIEQLTLEVKAQEKAIGDTRRNVGNYEDAIKDAVGSMIPFGGQLTEIAQSGGGVKGALTTITTGIAGATRAAIAFISTGIGAVIAALAGIGLATKAFFDYNAEVRKTNALISGLTNESGALVDQIRLQSDAISQTLGVEQEQLVQSAKVLVQQFGLSYEEALTKIQNGLLATNGANEEFLQSIGEYSTFFADAGFSVEEFANIVNAGFDLGIYSDKLPDALKEADISLREQTKATREALINAFGDDFTSNILKQINSGAMSTKQALELMSEEANKVGLSAEQAATLTADVFRGAGEDAGGALKVFEAINVSLDEQTAKLDEQGKRMQEDIARNQEVAEARDKALNNEGVQDFLKVLKDLGAFLTKVFYGAIELVGNLISDLVDAFNSVKNAVSGALKPLRKMGAALGITSEETKKATKSTGEFSDALQKAVKEIQKAAEAQAKLEAETERAAIVLKEAKERAEGYVEALQDIVTEQERQPLLMSAEDIFSERSAEEVTERLATVAKQIKENANITHVSVNGMSLTVEEYTRLAQQRLNDIEKQQDESRRRSQERSQQRIKEAEDEAQRLLELEDEQRLAHQKRIDDNIQAVRDEYDERIKAIQDGLAMEMLVKETAHLNELRMFQGTEEEKLALQEQFHLENLELQKQALQDQMAVIEKTLAEGDLLDMLETGILDESTKALAELRNALANVNLEIANAGKDEDGDDKTLAERLGIEPEQIDRAIFALDTLQESFAIAQQAIGAAETARLKQVDEQVERGVITEEQAEAKKERIRKKAARDQQKVSIIQAIINVAQGITKTFATVPSLFAPIIAATIAAQGAVQIAAIKAQKFAKGGILNGPSHAQGGIPMFSKGGAFYGEAEGGEAVLTKGVMANPALARMASAINVAGGGVPFFANGGVLDPIQSATPTDRAADIIASGLKSRQPVLVVEQLRERENSVDVIESLRTIG